MANIIDKEQVNFIQNGENLDKDVLNRPLIEVIDFLNSKGIIVNTDVVDALTSNSANTPLSANQGRILKQFIDGLSSATNSNDPNLNTLQKVVDYIKANRNRLDSLGISDVNGLVDALNDKSSVGHTHPMEQVNGLISALNGKSNTGHGHQVSDISGLGTAATRQVGVSSSSNIPDRAAADARYARTGTAVSFTSVTSGSFNQQSDETLKKDIVQAQPGLSRILMGVEYVWRESGEKDAGVIAQMVEQVLPHLVHTDKNGIKSVNYNGLIAYLIADVSELYKRMDELERKLDERN